MADRYPVVLINGVLKELPSGDTIPYASILIPNQTAKTFLAGPTSGGAAAPIFRTIGMTDLGTGTPSSSNFLRGDGSWQTISTGLTINSTAISSGTAGRILFQNGSNQVSQDSGLSFDSSTDALTVGSGALRMPNSSSVFLLATPHASYSGTLNVFIGTSAGAGNTVFHSNVYVGDNAGSNTSVDAYFNVFVGRNAGQNTQGRENTFLGCFAGSSNTSGAANVFIGYNTGSANTSGVNNVMIGKNAGTAYNANNAIFIGTGAGSGVTSGTQNTLIGSNAGSGFTSGGGNTALGYDAGGVSSTGTHYSCVFIGDGAGKSSTGNYNIMIGGTAAGGGVSGRGNIIMGYRAAYSLTSGALNVIIGTNEGSSAITTGSGNVFLGAEAGAQETGSNKLYIHNNNSTSPLIYGEFDNRILHWNAGKVRQKYDGSNYYDSDVSSAGVVTLNAVGSGAKFVFSDAVEVPSGTFGNIVDDSFDTTFNNASGGIVSLDQVAGFIFNTGINPQAAIGDWNSNGNGTYISIDDLNELIFLTNLPTSDPGIVDALYRDGSGNVKISI